MSQDNAQPPSTSGEGGPVTIKDAYKQAVDHINAGRFTEADRLCTQILKSVPNHVDTINLLGVIAKKINRHDLAVEQLQRAIAIDPKRSDLYFNLGTSLYQLGRGAEAVAALKSALQYDPDNIRLADDLQKIIRDVETGAYTQEIRQNRGSKARAGFIENLFGTSFKKNALLSYLTTPFTSDTQNPSHNNILICRTIANIIHEAGYNLDVVHFLNQERIAYQKYDFIFGLGHPFENSFFSPYKGKRFFLATGASTMQRNPAELYRLQQLRQRHGVTLSPRRLREFPDYASSMLSDAIFCTGNGWSAGTYRPYFNGPIHSLPVVTITDDSDNASGAGREFLWLGSDGAVLKGLDLCIEAFIKRPDLILNICGNKDPELLALYRDDLENRHNIKHHGFVEFGSEKSADIMKRCGFIIYPSASEGTAGSVLDCMVKGLIPIVTRESGVDIGDFGFAINNADVDAIVALVDSAAKVDQDQFQRRSRAAVEFVNANHRQEALMERLRDSLKQEIASCR